MIKDYMSDKMVNPDKFFNAEKYEITDLWTKAKSISDEKVFTSVPLKACDSMTIKITPV